MKKFFLLFSLLGLGLTLYAQSDLTISNIKARDYAGVRPLEGVGCYLPFEGDRVGGGMREFFIKVFNYDLEEQTEIIVEVPKRSVFIGTVYNGEAFMAAFICAVALRRSRTATSLLTTACLESSSCEANDSSEPTACS